MKGMPPQGPSHSSPLPVPGGESSGKTLFEDIFRELAGDPRPVPQPAESGMPYDVEEQTLNAPPAKPVKKTTAYTALFDSQSESLDQRITAQEPPLREISGQTIKNAEIAKNIDLRQAVIFSEILNKKYF